MKKITINPKLERIAIIILVALGVYLIAISFYRGFQDGRAEKAAKAKMEREQMKKTK